MTERILIPPPNIKVSLACTNYLPVPFLACFACFAGLNFLLWLWSSAL
jgi:hypothetical protein